MREQGYYKNPGRSREITILQDFMTTDPLTDSTAFTPRFNSDGLIPCIATSARTGEVLMFAWMNAEALERSLATGEAHYWSRSRGELWHKGATSGKTQKIVEIRTDCDQDCLWIKVQVSGAEIGCHTGRRSCFYRQVISPTGAKEAHLKFIEG